MKFIRKKTSILDVLLVAGVFVSFYLGEILTFTAVQKIAVGVVFLLGILVIALSSKKKTQQDMIEEEDERNQYIAMKCAAETGRSVGYACFVSILGCLIAFGLTREFLFIWIMVGAATPFGVLKIASILNAFRYDR